MANGSSNIMPNECPTGAPSYILRPTIEDNEGFEIKNEPFDLDEEGLPSNLIPADSLLPPGPVTEQPQPSKGRYNTRRSSNLPTYAEPKASDSEEEMEEEEEDPPTTEDEDYADSVNQEERDNGLHDEQNNDINMEIQLSDDTVDSTHFEMASRAPNSLSTTPRNVKRRLQRQQKESDQPPPPGKAASSLCSRYAYLCPVCQERTTSMSQLTQHVYREHGSRLPETLYACLHCGMIYPTTQDVQAHVDDIHPGQPVVCPVCGKLEASLEALRNHCHEHHMRSMRVNPSPPPSPAPSQSAGVTTAAVVDQPAVDSAAVTTQ